MSNAVTAATSAGNESTALGARHPSLVNRVWVRCSLRLSTRCRGERWRKVDAPLQVIATGSDLPCGPCAAVADRGRTGIVRHVSRAWILYDERPDVSVAGRSFFICANAADWWAAAPTDARDRDAYLRAHPGSVCLVKDVGVFKRYDSESWGGRCEGCNGLFENHPRTLKSDVALYGWAETPSRDAPYVGLRAWIRYSKGNPKEVPVWFPLCGDEEQMQRASLKSLRSQHQTKRGEFPEACSECRHDAGRLAAKVLARSGSASGGYSLLEVHSDLREQRSGGSKNGRTGRPRKFTNEAAFKAIDALGSRVSVAALARKLGCSRPPVNDWVREQGYASLPELLRDRRSGGAGN